MKVIAIGHIKGVGKNTFANFCSSILRERCRGANIQVVNIANCLKDAARMLYSGAGLQHWSHYEETPAAKDVPLANSLTPRDIWLKMGIILNAWDDCIFIRETLTRSQCDYLFIPDLRRKREIEFLGDYETITIKLTRGTPVKQNDIDDELMDHKFDLVIDNDGDRNTLHKKAEEFVTTHLYKSLGIPTGDRTGGNMMQRPPKY